MVESRRQAPPETFGLVRQQQLIYYLRK